MVETNIDAPNQWRRDPEASEQAAQINAQNIQSIKNIPRFTEQDIDELTRAQNELNVPQVISNPATGESITVRGNGSSDFPFISHNPSETRSAFLAKVARLSAARKGDIYVQHLQQKFRSTAEGKTMVVNADETETEFVPFDSEKRRTEMTEEFKKNESPSAVQQALLLLQSFRKKF